MVFQEEKYLALLISITFLAIKFSQIAQIKYKIYLILKNRTYYIERRGGKPHRDTPRFLSVQHIVKLHHAMDIFNSKT